jgi:hypothetical protein
MTLVKTNRAIFACNAMRVRSGERERERERERQTERERERLHIKEIAIRNTV